MRPLILLLAVHAASAAVVEGRVTSTAGGSPVIRTEVTLTGASGSYTAQTGADGSFRIEGVAPGIYRPSARRAGFLFSAKRVAELIVEPDETNVRLDLRLIPTAVISGRVLDSDGDPISHASVQAMQYSYAQGAKQLLSKKSAATDDRGRYRLFDLPPSRYLLRVTGTSIATAYYPTAATASGAAPVDVAAGAELAAIDIRSGPQMLYSIRVQVPPGGVFRPVIQRVRDAERLNSFSGHTRGGVLEIPNLPRGSYLLTGQWIDNNDRRFAHQYFEIVDRDVDGGALKLVSTADIAGIIEGPPRGVRLSLDPVIPNPLPYPKALANDDGTFRFLAVAPDVYLLRVTLRPGTYLKALRAVGRDLPSQQLDLTRSTGPVAISLGTDGAELAGLVTDSEGSPADRALVALAPVGEGWPDRLKTVSTDAHGNFRMDDIAPGAYRLFAWEEAEPGAAYDPEFRKPFERYSVPVQIGAEESRTIVLKCAPGASL